MTVITVNATKGRLDREQRRKLAETLTDAVLVPEVGQFAPAARMGFTWPWAARCERYWL